eukprot:TRINITY_DN9614_c0_g1_i1.p1 TRINITY_DN9614_c0_g1~~TRINITY_DN9614_c0_g1_i1.p1  ORF type:complete len:344 (+),score=77.79 TRINITY_DN9614_c0_g1_i1:73-1032(+)
MSFGGAGWSDEESKGGVMGESGEKEVKKATRKVIVKRRIVGGGAVLDKPKVVKKVVRKRGRDDDEDEEMAEAASRPPPSGVGAKRLKNIEGKAVKLPPAPLPPAGVGRFHSIADPEFSDIALPRPGQDGRSGAWIGSKCRCLQCELTRVATGLKGKNTICLLDLDNFGYPHWVKQASPHQLQAAGKPPENVFLWGFYGLGFEAHGHKGDPMDAISWRSLFGVFNKTQQLRLSPCGNFPQAADEAMQKTVEVLRNMNLVIVSSDKPNLRACAKAHAAQPLLPGRKRKNFTSINPSSLHMDSAAVWQEVADFAAANAEESQ